MVTREGTSRPDRSPQDRSVAHHGPPMTSDHTIPRPSHVLLRSRAATVAISVAAVALGVVAAAQPDWLLTVDRPVANFLRGDELIGFFRFWTDLGSQQDMIVVAVVVGALLWRRCRAFAVALPAAIGLGILADVSLKVLVDRPRPPEPLVGTALGSFPSGHAITGVIFFGLLPPVIWVAFRRRLLFWSAVPLAAVVAALVVLSRVYLGAHWPSDVVASLFIGTAVLLATEYALGSPLARRFCACTIHSPGHRPG